MIKIRTLWGPTESVKWCQLFSTDDDLILYFIYKLRIEIVFGSAWHPWHPWHPRRSLSSLDPHMDYLLSPGAYCYRMIQIRTLWEPSESVKWCQLFSTDDDLILYFIYKLRIEIVFGSAWHPWHPWHPRRSLSSLDPHMDYLCADDKMLRGYAVQWLCVYWVI